MTVSPPKAPMQTRYEYVSDRRELPRVRREWLGRRVAVRFVGRRGHAYRRTSIGWAYGVLVENADPKHVSVRERDGYVRDIHYTRINYVFDLTRPKRPGTEWQPENLIEQRAKKGAT